MGGNKPLENGWYHRATLMLTLEQSGGFLLAASLLTLAPGPDNLLVLAIGMSRGRGAGIAFGLGCAAGCLNHTLLAVLGVSALIAASPLAFMAVKIAGGIYLLWLGIQSIQSAGPSSPTPDASIAPESLPQLFRMGLIANAINPKVLLFFLAFLPQFVDSTRGQASLQLGLLGVLFTAQAALIFSLIGWSAGRIGTNITEHSAITVWLNRAAGFIFVLLGVRLLWA